MPGPNKRLTRIGFGKQTAKGSPLATPVYGIGVTDGKVFDVDWADNPREITGASRFNESAVRESLGLMVPFSTYVMPLSIGTLLKGLLGADAITGAGPYTHTMTPTNALDWLTFWGRYDTEYIKLSDCQVDELKFSWERDGDLKAELKVLVGLLSDWSATPWTATTDEDTSAGVMSARGGTFTFDGNPAKIVSGEITYANQLIAHELAEKVLFDDLTPGNVEAAISLKVLPANLNSFRKALTGADAGTAVQSVPQFGSFSHLFKIDASTDLSIASTKLLFSADFPDSDPKGGPAEVTLAGVVHKPAAGAEFSAVLRNTRSTAY